MKQFALLFYSVFLFSCNQKGQTHNDNMQKLNNRNFGVELIDNGFLNYADSSMFDILKKQVVDSFDLYEDNNFKIAHIDAEELAEFSFEFFLPSLNKILAKRNIKLSAKKLNAKENSYDALINSDTVALFTQKDLDNNTFWDTAPRNFFKKANQILKEKNCDEQFYLLYGGNDLHTMLLTDKQFSIIADYYKDKIKETAYKP